MDHGAQILAHADKFEAFARRDDMRDLGSAVRRGGKRGTTARARRITDSAMLLVLLIVVLIVAGLFVETIGVTGILVTLAVMLAGIMTVGFWPRAATRPIPPYREDMPSDAVARRLATLLGRQRAALPPAAGQRVDAMFRQLPLLEKQLATLDPLAPLAQDARRLMGEHIPELIDRYERVPPQYRRERDGEGMSMDDRLVSGLDAARVALDDLERQLARQDVDGFQTQSRFLESRYKDGELGGGQ